MGFRRGIWGVFGLSLAGLPVAAEVPVVVADIAPVHGLAAQVMEGVGDPNLLLPAGVSPHGHAMRPSDAAALQAADLVIWIGPNLTPWLEEPVEALAADAVHLELLEHPVTGRLDFRQGAAFAHDDHEDHDDHGHDDHEDHGEEDHGDHGHDDHGEEDHDGHGHDDHAEEGHDGHDGHAEEGHDDHDDHGHEDHAGHDDHGDHGDHAGHDDHDDHGHEGHDHSGTDPHAWLDPVNAQNWLPVIAGALAELDPDNADRYRANAEAAAADLAAQAEEIEAQLAGLEGRFILQHDAYRYFEERFGLQAAGAISFSDASPPSPARLAEIRELGNGAPIACIFVEPQISSNAGEALFGANNIRTGRIDPLGAALTPGPTLYGDLLGAMADSFENCLRGG